MRYNYYCNIATIILHAFGFYDDLIEYYLFFNFDSVPSLTHADLNRTSMCDSSGQRPTACDCNSKHVYVSNLRQVTLSLRIVFYIKKIYTGKESIFYNYLLIRSWNFREHRNVRK